MFSTSTNFKNICCVFAENKIFEKSKMVAEMANYCHSNSS